MCEDATRNTVNAVTGMPNAAMKMAAACFALRHWLSTRVEGEVRLRICRAEDVPPGNTDQGRLGGLQRQGEGEPVGRDVADVSEHAGRPVPEAVEHVPQLLSAARRSDSASATA